MAFLGAFFFSVPRNQLQNLFLWQEVDLLSLLGMQIPAFWQLSVVIPVSAAFPVTVRLMAEENQGYYPMQILRERKYVYLTKTVLAAVITGFLLTFLTLAASHLLYIIIGNIRGISVGMHASGMLAGDLKEMAENGQGYLPYISMIIWYSMFGSLWSVVGVLVFCFVKNRYMAAVMPLFLWNVCLGTYASGLVSPMFQKYSWILKLTPVGMNLTSITAETIPEGFLFSMACLGFWCFLTFCCLGLYLHRKRKRG